MLMLFIFQKHKMENHGSGVTGTCFSPDNSMLATCSKNGVVIAWNTTDFRIKSRVTTPGQCLCCAFSPDGSTLAVSMSQGTGMVLINSATWQVVASNTGYSSYNICLAYAPSGATILTGGDNSAITVWDGNSGSAINQWRGHQGWIWGLAYTADGDRVLSCSSDRSLKVWNANNGSVLVSLGGHLHRVCWASLAPSGGNSFVTCSLDFVLKVCYILSFGTYYYK